MVGSARLAYMARVAGVARPRAVQLLRNATGGGAGHGFVCDFFEMRVVRMAIWPPSMVMLGRGEAVSRETGVDEFTEFVRLHEPRLRQALVAARGVQVGRDAACDALAYGWEHWDRVSVLDNPVGYLYRVGVRSRQASDRRSLLFEGDAARIPDVEPKLVDSISRLPQRQRTVVVLVHCFEWSLSEVAEVTGLAKSTVQNHLERGMRSLRTSLGVDR